MAIFGGSFDPPHRGHQKIVSEAVQTLDIDRLLIVPAYLNPFKQSSLAPPAIRLEWCHTLFDTMPKVAVSDYEIRQGESTYTSQTVKHFQNEYDVKYLIIGSDNLKSLTKWHEFEWLNEQVTWVVATRHGSHMNTEMLKKWKRLELDVDISSTEIRNLKQLDSVDRKIQDSVKSLLKEKQ
ncbi:MAG: nicotinate (nicotinamide) nucleotide adenylyltransferase [Sulfurimonas sp.]